MSVARKCLKRFGHDAFASRRLGELGFFLREGPVEPVGQRLDVGGLDRRAAPDAQARRRVAIGADVVGDLLLFEQRRPALGEGGLRVGGERGDLPDRRPSGRRWCWSASRGLGEEVDPGGLGDPVGERFGVGVGARDQRVEAADLTSPIAARRDNPRRRASRAC